MKIKPIELKTLSDFHETGHSLTLYCGNCRPSPRSVKLDLTKLVADPRVGPDFEPTPANLRQAFRCDGCGSKAFDVLVGGRRLCHRRRGDNTDRDIAMLCIAISWLPTGGRLFLFVVFDSQCAKCGGKAGMRLVTSY